jgi:hypothetical protein
MVALFVFSSLLIGVRITALIWLTAAVVMAAFTYGFYMMVEGSL